MIGRAQPELNMSKWQKKGFRAHAEPVQTITVPRHNDSITVSHFDQTIAH